MVDRGCTIVAQAVVELALDSGMPREKVELRVALFLEDFLRTVAGPGAGEVEDAHPRVGGTRLTISKTAAP